MRKNETAEKAPATKPANVRVITDTALSRYDFLPAEIEKLGRELATAVAQQAQIAEEASVAAAEYKAQGREVGKTVNSISEKIRVGYEMRPVVVRKELNLDNGVCTVAIKETGEILEVRAVLDSERQLVLEVGQDSALDTLEKGTRLLEGSTEAEDNGGEPKPASTGKKAKG